MKKGQITMESLLLYGVALLVVLLAIGALTFFGVLDLGRFLPDRCTLASSGSIECAEFAARANEIQLGIKNNGASAINIVDFEFVQEGNGATCTLAAPVNGVQPGLIELVELDCGTPFQTELVGRKVRGTLEGSYLVVGGAVTQTTGGSLVATLNS